MTGIEIPSQDRSYYISVFEFYVKPQDKQWGYHTIYGKRIPCIDKW